MIGFTAYARFLAGDGNGGGLVGTAEESPQPEEQNGDYESGTVDFGGERWRIRTAMVTPTKPGAFVAVWQRDAAGATTPFGVDDATAGLLVFVAEGERFGVFEFSAAHLASLGVTRSATQPGKRGFRVYPSWSAGLNRQAQRSQVAQAPAFRELSETP